MTEKSVIRTIAEQYLQGDAIEIPMTPDIEYRGPMLAEPLRGEEAVRAHLSDTSPFASLELRELLVSDDSAAALIDVVLVNGVRLPGSVFLRVRDGRLAFIETLFDSHGLYTGGN